MPVWLWRHSWRCMAIAAGSRGMGCIGYPDHPVWEVTRRCNLSCMHCHVGSQEAGQQELTTAEGRQLIAALREIRSFRTLVYSGGEPLVRQDLCQLLEYSQKKGFINLIASNATLIDRNVARDLKRFGVAGVAVSLDSAEGCIHNKIRRNEQAFDLAMRGIDALASANISLQVNITAMEYNVKRLDSLVALCRKKNVALILLYQLVPVGRGEEIADAGLDAKANQSLLDFIARAQENSPAIIEPVAGPQVWPHLLRKKNLRRGVPLAIAERLFHGCCAGRGFVYIKADGDVWPCPFIPVTAGNVRREPFAQLWLDADVFRRLRSREQMLQGSCGTCDFKKVCGGCRGRALAASGDLMAEDPTCFIHGEPDA